MNRRGISTITSAYKVVAVDSVFLWLWPAGRQERQGVLRTPGFDCLPSCFDLLSFVVITGAPPCRSHPASDFSCSLTQQLAQQQVTCCTTFLLERHAPVSPSDISRSTRRDNVTNCFRRPNWLVDRLNKWEEVREREREKVVKGMHGNGFICSHNNQYVTFE